MRPSDLKGKTSENLWEETSGLLGFLSKIDSEVRRFEDTTGFGLRVVPSPPEFIDGSQEMSRDVGFLVIRENLLLPERTYCLYSILHERKLYGYIGVINDGAVTTLRQVGHIGEFRKAAMSLHGWLKQLVKASCEKY